MNRRALRITATAATIVGTLLVAVAWLQPAPRFLWNASASAPTGLYRVDVGAPARLGDLVAFYPPASIGAFLVERRYLPPGVPLLKRVAALPGSRVCRSGIFVSVDGQGVARALARDRQGRMLPVWHGCRIVGPHELFLVNAARGSLDGRYFGPMRHASLLGVAHPILTRDAPGAPLRWRRAAGAHPFSRNNQE
jgi:conjugative transfer signal peptidase TraF